MRIPRVLHQTWKNRDIPEEFERMSQTWKDKHRGWEHVFWTDEMNRNFIKEHFSFFLSIYDNYPTNIQRVDAVRYFVLYKYGGFFIDLDFECLANIEPLVSNTSCVFGKEPLEHCLIHQKDVIISNAFMGTVPGFHFLGALCKELEADRQLTDHPNNKVLEVTGPFMLSRLYNDYKRKEDILLLDADLIYPLTKDELEDWNGTQQNQAIQQKLERAYGIHHYAGTWWKKNLV
ncbi:glycosyltransferase family 32 protein [Chitinophaga sp. 22536]|uniref:glycosyltransferase family 32 protein n=1 Tax=unclassified Chitinophaga TaxID=2619133 RepID=UPI003F8356F7